MICKVVELSVCPICSWKYEGEACLMLSQKCVADHEKRYAAECPRYAVGIKVKSHLFGDSNLGERVVTVVATKGELTSLRLLVESKDGERWWIEPCSYHPECGSRRSPKDGWFSFAEVLP